MGKRYHAPGPWRASRGSIAAVAVAVFLAVSTRPVFADPAVPTRAYLSAPSDFGLVTDPGTPGRCCRTGHADG